MQGSKRVTFSGVTALALVFMVSAAQAAPITSTWDAGDGSWDSINRWDNGTVPNNADGSGNNYTAVIDNGRSPRHRTDSTIDILRLGETTPSTLRITDNSTLTLEGNDQQPLTFDLSDPNASVIGAGSTLDIGSALGNPEVFVGENAFLYSEGTIDNDGTFTVESTGSIIGGSGELKSTDGTGTTTVGGNGFRNELRFEDDAVFSSGALESTDDAHLNFGGNTQMTGGTLTIGGEFGLDMEGNAEIAGGTVNNNDGMAFFNDAKITGGLVTNTDNIDFAGDTVTRGSGISGGTVNNNAGATISVGGFAELSGGFLENDGAIGVSSNGEFELTGGTLDNNGTLNNAGKLTIDTGVTFFNAGGTLNNESGGELFLKKDMAIASATTGTINLKSGSTFDNDAKLSINSGATLDSNGAFINRHEIENNGVLSLNAGSSFVSGLTSRTSFDINYGTLNNNAGGLINLATDMMIGPSEAPGAGLVNLNAGSTLDVKSTGSLTIGNTTQLGGTIKSNSSLDVRSGAELDVLSGGRIENNTGGIIDVNGTLDFNVGSTFDNTGGTLNNENGGEINLGIDLTLGSDAAGTVNLKTGSTLNNDAILTFSSGARHSDGTINNTERLNFIGTSAMTGGEVTNNDIMSLEDSEITGGTVTNNEDLILYDNSEMSGGIVTNNGQLDLLGSAQISNGMVDNENGAVLNIFDTAQISGNAIINNKSGAELTFSGTSATERAKMTGGTITNTQGSVTFGNNSELAGGTVDNAALGGGVRFNGNAIMSSGLLKSENNADTFFSGNSELSGGDVQNTGTGNLIFEQSSTMSGTATVTNDSHMTLNDSAQISGGIVTNNDALELNDTAQMSGGTVNNDGTVNLNNDSAVTAGTIANSATVFLNNNAQLAGGSIDNDGTVFLTDSSQMSGGSIENDGSLLLRDNSQITGGTVTNNSGGFIVRQGSGSSTIAAAVENQGVVDGNNGGLIFTGDVTGAGSYEGLVQFDGNFRPGNSPALIDAETLIFGSSNSLFMEIGGLTRGTEYDAFDISGAVTFGGLLDLSFINSFLPSGPSTFDLFNFGSASGTFANIVLPTLDSLWLWNTDSLYTDGSISIVAAVIDTGVPGPGAVFILVIGLAGFAGLRCRNK